MTARHFPPPARHRARACREGPLRRETRVAILNFLGVPVRRPRWPHSFGVFPVRAATRYLGPRRWRGSRLLEIGIDDGAFLRGACALTKGSLQIGWPAML